MNSIFLALEPVALQQILAARELAPAPLAASLIQLSPGNGRAADDPLYSVDEDGVAHIAIVGLLTQHAMTDACGAYTAEALTEYGYITAAVEAADKDPQVSLIAFEVNSPGGYVDGIEETADAIAAAEKETVTLASHATSGAYWLASQTDRIIATSRLAAFGSIGVVVELPLGDARSVVITSTDAPYKRLDACTDDGRAKIREQLDAVHAVFVDRVARGRGITVEHVNQSYGRGSVLLAGTALGRGMIDEVFDHVDRRNGPVDEVAAAAQTLRLLKFGDADPQVLGLRGEPWSCAGLRTTRPRSADLSTDDIAAAKLAGMSIDEYKLYSGRTK